MFHHGSLSFGGLNLEPKNPKPEALKLSARNPIQVESKWRAVRLLDANRKGLGLRVGPYPIAEGGPGRIWLRSIVFLFLHRVYQEILFIVQYPFGLSKRKTVRSRGSHKSIQNLNPKPE